MIPRIAFVVSTACWICVASFQTPGVEALNENRGPINARNRRHFLKAFVATSSISSAAIVVLPSPSNAVRGAAELDLEYYARDLFGGNRREGNVEASRGPPLPPARTLQEPLLSMLLSEDATCVPKKALISMLLAAKTGPFSQVDHERLLQDSFVNYRAMAAKAFSSRAPFATESLRDQYYFDLSTYALWRTAGDLLPNTVDRDLFMRQMGRNLYQSMISDKLVSATPFKKDKITSTASGLQEVLQVFRKYGFIKSYRLSGAGDSSNDVSTTGGVDVFDSLDDEALADGATVDFLLSVIEPATLGAALQITGEQSRFAPDYISPTVATLLEMAGFKCTWETFFVDNEYRPNPKDYFPSEQLIQFSVRR